MQLKHWMCLLGAAFAAVLTSIGAEGPADLLQKGLFEEEANHNLQSAIKAYQSVIQQTDEHRRLGATAIFRLGECYRKLGQTNEALVQYRRVLKEFPDQQQLTQASQRLVDELQPKTSGSGGAVPSSVIPARGVVPASVYEEAEELRKIQAMVKDSPDLVNARFEGSGTTEGNMRQTRLHVAATRGWSSVAEFLITNQADINITDAYGRTPLHYAASSSHKGLLEFLLAHGADVKASDKFGLTPLHEAASRGYKTIVEVLLDAKANVDARTTAGLTPLHYAARGGHRVVGEVLLKHSAGFNHQTTGVGPEPGRAAGETPIHFAAAYDQPAFVELLASEGAKVDVKDNDGNTALHLAIAPANSTRTLETLLRYHPNLNNTNNFGITPLSRAVELGRLDEAEVLLKNGANPNIADIEGQYPLHKAVTAERVPMVELLITNKANLNLQNRNGSTPLHYAVNLFRTLGTSSNDDANRAYLLKIIKQLLAHKADPNIRNQEGLNVLNLFGVPAKANRPDQEEVVTLLKSQGATDNFPELPPDPNTIRLWRQGLSYGRTRWLKPTAGRNRFTVLETIWTEYRNPAPQPVAPYTPALSPIGGQPPLTDQSFDFPDLSRITVHRLVNGKDYTKIEVNLLNNGVVNCSADIPLEFGDVVEIPEREHVLGTPREGLPNSLRPQIVECLAKRVQLSVPGSSVELPLEPGEGRYLSKTLQSPAALKLLRSSSDFSRVKVMRRDATAGKMEVITLNEIPFRQGSKRLPDDLLLVEGDTIEVPDLSKP